jgi:hypothetical protein
VKRSSSAATRSTALATRRKSPRNSRNEMIAEMTVEGLAAALRGLFVF